MSHFTVLVIGKDSEEQLAPFHQFECTGENNEYVQDVDITEEIREGIEVSEEKTAKAKLEDALGYHGLEDKIVESEDEVDLDNTHKYGYAIVKKGKLIKAINRTNPNYKWDWYQLGGRWTGFFKLKSSKNNGISLTKERISELATQYRTSTAIVEGLVKLISNGNDFNEISEYNRANPVMGGYHLEQTLRTLLTPKYDSAEVGSGGLGAALAPYGWVDSARVKDIDFEGMVRHAGNEARQKYEQVEALLGGSIPKLEFTWKQIIDDKGKFNKMPIDERRALYHNQPGIQKVKELRKNSFKLLSKEDESLLFHIDFGGLDEFQVTIEEYERQAERRALSTFAVLKDGEWYQRGEMGWWGSVSDEKEQDKWNEEFMKLIKDLPEDTILSVYDCHI